MDFLTGSTDAVIGHMDMAGSRLEEINKVLRKKQRSFLSRLDIGSQIEFIDACCETKMFGGYHKGIHQRRKGGATNID